MEINPTLAPRSPKCPVCTLVASPADLTIRLFGPDLEHLPLVGAIEYLAAVGIAGDTPILRSMAMQHRRHCDEYIKRGGAIPPAQFAEGLTRISPPTGPTRWVDVNQRALDLGLTAAQILADRLLNPNEMATREVIAVANMGQTAAVRRASAEHTGQIKRAEAMAQLASGFKKPEPGV